MNEDKSKLLEIIGIVLALNIYTFSIDKIQFTYLIFYIFVLLILLFSSLKYSVRYSTEIIIYLIPIIYLFFSLIYSYDFNRGFKFSLFFSVFILIHIILSKRNDWHKSFYTAVLIMSYIFVIITIFAYFFPNLYLKLFFHLFNHESQVVILRLINAGAQVGLTNQTAKNGFLISIGLGILINQLLNNKKPKILIYISIIFYIIALIMTLKRSFIIAHIISIILIVYINFKFSNKKINNYIKFLIIIGMIITIMLILEPFIPVFEKIMARFTITDYRDFTSGRFNIYKAGYELFKEKPFVGNGIYSTPLLLKEKYGLHGIQQMHNIYLQFLAELGLIGTSIFITLIIIAYLITYKLLKKSCFYYNEDVKLMLGTSFYIQNFWLIYGFFGNPFTEHIFLLTYLIFLSIPFYYRKAHIVDNRFVRNEI